MLTWKWRTHIVTDINEYGVQTITRYTNWRVTSLSLNLYVESRIFNRVTIKCLFFFNSHNVSIQTTITGFWYNIPTRTVIVLFLTTIFYGKYYFVLFFLKCLKRVTYQLWCIHFFAIVLCDAPLMINYVEI